MLYLYSSDATLRYKNDVLDSLAYPEGHIFRFRYQDTYVSKNLKSLLVQNNPLEGRTLKKSCSDKKGLIIYAEAQGTAPHKIFNFYPVREVKIIRIFREGSIFYVDFKFGKFVNYGRLEKAEENKTKFQDHIEATLFHPIPPVTETQGKVWDLKNKRKIDYKSSLKKDEITCGYFLSHIADKPEMGIVLQKFCKFLGKFKHINKAMTNLQKAKCDPKMGRSYSIEELSQNEAWESVADVLSCSNSMASCVFFLTKGFYKVRRQYWLLGPYREILTKPSDDKWTTTYQLPMGKSAVLKLLFYRSERSSDIFPQKLDVKIEGEGFAGVSQKEILVDSHYNEERLIIACKRVFDVILLPISIDLKKEKAPDTLLSGSSPNVSGQHPEILAPRLHLLTQVIVPKRTMVVILFGLIMAPLLLSLSPDFLSASGNSQIMQGWYKSLGDYIAHNAGWISLGAKVVAAVVTFVAGYFGFRKLPIGK